MGTKYPIRIIALIVVLIVLYIHAYVTDSKNKKNAEDLDYDICYKIDITEYEKQKIESVIKNFKEIKDLKKSKKEKIKNEVIMTVINAAISGIVISNNTISISGIVALGSISGILTWLRHNMPLSK